MGATLLILRAVHSDPDITAMTDFWRVLRPMVLTHLSGDH